MMVFVVRMTWLISDQYGTFGDKVIGVYSSEQSADEAIKNHRTDLPYAEYHTDLFELDGRLI